MYDITIEFYDARRLPETYTVDEDNIPDLNSFEDGDTALIVATIDESVIQFQKQDIQAIYAFPAYID